MMRYSARMSNCPVCGRHFDSEPFPEHDRATGEAMSMRRMPCEASGRSEADAYELPIARARREV